ncbi:hypothetical protein ACA910_010660 [Epithemia clementina (nom. ined.)]
MEYSPTQQQAQNDEDSSSNMLTSQRRKRTRNEKQHQQTALHNKRSHDEEPNLQDNNCSDDSEHGGCAFASLEALLYEEEQSVASSRLVRLDPSNRQPSMMEPPSSVLHRRHSTTEEFGNPRSSFIPSSNETLSNNENLTFESLHPNDVQPTTMISRSITTYERADTALLVLTTMGATNNSSAQNNLSSSFEDPSTSLLDQSRRALDQLQKRKKPRLQSRDFVSSSEYICSNRGMLIPKHWGGNDNNKMSASAKEQSRRKAEVTSRHLRGITSTKTTSIQAKSSKSRSKLRNSVVPLASLADSLEKRRQNRSSFGTENKNRHQHELRTISFAPSFVVNLLPTTTENPAVEEAVTMPGVDVEDIVVTSPSRRNFNQSWLESPPSSRTSLTASSSKSKPSTGRWSVRYRKLRDSIRADALRLRTSPGGDPLDPRKTAIFRTDVTIVTNPTPSNLTKRTFAKQGGSTILVFVHAHRRHQGSVDLEHGNSVSGLAWCFLSNVSIHDRHLKVGAQLRFYNAVVVPTSGVMWNIFGSRLIEEYPKSEPPLPPLSQLAAFR